MNVENLFSKYCHSLEQKPFNNRKTGWEKIDEEREWGVTSNFFTTSTQQYRRKNESMSSLLNLRRQQKRIKAKYILGLLYMMGNGSSFYF